MIYLLLSAIGLVALATLATLDYFDRRNLPPNFDEDCSKIDQELNEQGK